MRYLLALALLLSHVCSAQYAALRSENSGAESSTTTTVVVTRPATVEAGDLGIDCVTVDGANNNTGYGWGSSTSFLVVNHGSVRTECAWWDAAGTEDSGTVNVTLDAGTPETAAWYSAVFCEAADPGTTAPSGTGTSATASTVDPPSHTPAGGSAAYLWMVILGIEGEAITAFPSGYIDTGQQFATGGIPRIGWGFRQNTASSEDPGTASLAGADQHTAMTINIPPGANSSCPSAPMNSAVERRRRQ